MNMPEDQLKNNAVAPREFEKEIVAAVKSGFSTEKLREVLDDYHDNDIAHALPLLTQKERKILYVALGDERISDVFSYLDDPEPFVNEMSDAKVADIVENMDSDDATDVLDELDEERKQDIINLMDADSARDLKLISNYEEDEVGSRMTNDYVSVDRACTVKEAMKSVIGEAAENDNISTVFVTENGVFKGAFKLKDLVIARSTTPLDDIIVSSFPYLYADDKISDVLSDLKSYAEECIPVLDNDNRLIGALTSADVIEAVDDEMSEDYAKLAGLASQTEEDEKVGAGMLKRLPWLIILLVLDLFIGAYTGIFEAIIVGVPFLVCFQQMISGMSGNVGTQSLAVSVRVLSRGDADGKIIRKMVGKELLVGFLNGAVIGVFSMIAVTLFAYLTNTAGGFSGSATAGLAVGLSMIAATTVSSLTGTLIPLFFYKIKIDPAVASGPLITTVNDLAAISVYYGTAMILFAGLL